MTYNQLPPSYLALGTVARHQPRPILSISASNHPQTLFNQPLVSYSQLLKLFRSIPRERVPQASRQLAVHSLRWASPSGSAKVSAQISLTTGKLIDDVSQTVTFLGARAQSRTSTTAPLNGRSSQDISKRLAVSSDYELPFGRGRHFLGASRLRRFAIGGWQVNGIATFQTVCHWRSQRAEPGWSWNPGQRPNTNGKTRS